MSTARKITISLPARILDEAVKITGKGITETIIDGLVELRRRDQRSALRRLRGKIRFELDVDESRR